MTSTTGRRAPQGQPPDRPRRRSGLRFAARAARKGVVTTLGALVILVGVVLLPLPGPGMLVVGLGLGLLATEYHWPRRLLHRLRVEASVWAGRARDRRNAQRGPRGG